MKPDSVLTELEREPVIYFGCTWSEITRALRSALLFAVVAGALVAFVLGLLLPGPAVFAATALIVVLATGFRTWRQLQKTGRMRAGKPLFYEKHRVQYRTPLFIQPVRRYQRERNHDSQTQN